jgi:hypothetical protein
MRFNCKKNLKKCLNLKKKKMNKKITACDESGYFTKKGSVVMWWACPQ